MKTTIPMVGTESGRLRTCQAVLASVVGLSHISLDETLHKKKQLNEAEIALRRGGTAHKRKHLSKKLKDEKAERINRLLKKNLAHEIGATNSPVQKIAHLQPTLAMARLQKARSTRKRAAEWQWCR
ncbi:hypothetical protein BC827DRAFT_105998 [Russula dissimulans]|nr:hypothetical protein BC827DRAFT_105998 [Russula dissimulans]